MSVHWKRKQDKLRNNSSIALCVIMHKCITKQGTMDNGTSLFQYYPTLYEEEFS